MASYLPPEPSCQSTFAFKCMYLNSWISECTFQYCALHYVTAFPGEAKHTCLLIPDTHRSKDGYCQGPTWWTVSFIVVTQRNVSERLLILIKVEMTQRQLYHQSSSSMGDSSKAWEPGAHYMACRQLMSWIVSFPDASVCLREAVQVSKSSLQLGSASKRDS